MYISALFDIFRWVGVSMKNETPVNFLTNPLDRRSTLRHADVIYGVHMGRRKQACVDLTGVSILVGVRVEAFTVG